MAEFDFEYQGYYDFVDDFIGKEANTVFFHNEPNHDIDHIQNESWISDAQPFAYITDHGKTIDGNKTAVYELRDWTTDEVIGEVRVEDDDDYYDGTSITYNNTSYTYNDNNSGVSSYTDLNVEDTIYCFDSRDDSKRYFIFRGSITSKLYEMIWDDEEMSQHEWGFIGDDDGGIPFNSNLNYAIDLTDERVYKRIYNNRNAKSEDYEWVDREEGTIRVDGQIININKINSPQNPRDIKGFMDLSHCVIRDNGQQPIEKTTINVERSFYDEITSYPQYQFQGIKGTIIYDEFDEREDFVYPLIIARFRDNIYGYTQIKLYIDPTIENPFDIVGPNQIVNGFSGCDNIYDDEFDDYIELNIIDDITPDPGRDPEPTPDPGPDPEPTPEPEPEYDPEKAYKKMKELSEGYMFFDEETKNISYLLDIMRHNLYNGKGELVGTDAKLFKK